MIDGGGDLYNSSFPYGVGVFIGYPKQDPNIQRAMTLQRRRTSWNYPSPSRVRALCGVPNTATYVILQ